MGFLASLSSLVAANWSNPNPEVYPGGGEEEEEQKPLKKKLKKSPSQEEEEGGEKKVTQRKTDPGRRVISGRIYDSKLGVTCHWCRQKTVEDHAFCRNCNIAFCGLCLRNRHNERVKLEMDKSSNWLCPKCRGGCGEGCLNCCNCGPCRKSQGLEPTGMLIRKARLAEFTNVHDYLVHLKTGETQEIISQRKLGKGWCVSIDFKETEEAELEKPHRRSKPKTDHPAIQSIQIESIRHVKSKPDSKGTTTTTTTTSKTISKIAKGGGYNFGSLRRVKIRAEDSSHKSAITGLRKAHSHQTMGNRASNLKPLKAVKSEAVDDASCLNHPKVEVGIAVNPFLQVKAEPEMWVKAEAEDEVNISQFNTKTEHAQNEDEHQGPLIKKADVKPAVQMLDLDQGVEEESTVCQGSEKNYANESSIQALVFPTQIPMEFGNNKLNYSAFRSGEIKEKWTLPTEDFQFSSLHEFSDLESHQVENGGNVEDCLHSPQMRNLMPCELKQLETISLMYSAECGESSIEPSFIESSLQTFATVKEEGREMVLPEGSDLYGTQSQTALSQSFATVKVEEGMEAIVTPTSKMTFSQTFAAVKIKEERVGEVLPEVSDMCGTQNQMGCLLPAITGFNETVVGSEKVMMDLDDQSCFEEDFEEETFSSTPTRQKSNKGESLIHVLDEDQGEQNTPEVLKVSAEKRGSDSGLPSSVRRSGNFKLELEKRLNEAFCLEQLSEMWEAIIERKPVYKVRVTRQGMSSFATQEEGISYLDHYPDLADRLALTDESAEKLKLLRGFFFWLQHASAPDAFRPWFESSNQITTDDDCAEIDGPDCEILAVVHPVDDQTSNQNWTVEGMPPVSLKMEI